jgi:hypothetical protein
VNTVLQRWNQKTAASAKDALNSLRSDVTTNHASSRKTKTSELAFSQALTDYFCFLVANCTQWLDPF